MSKDRSGNGSSVRINRVGWRTDGWNPYVGEEEPAGGCCAGAGSLQRQGSPYSSMELPRLSREETEDMDRWGENEMDARYAAAREPDRKSLTPVPKPVQDVTRPMPVPVPVPAQPRSGMPYQRYSYEEILEEEKELEKDFRRLQTLYPRSVLAILPHIEETCDQMEYEGSMMFDEMPDLSTVRRLCDAICGQVQDSYPPQEELPQEDGVTMQEYRGRGEKRRPGKNPLKDLVQVMLVQEMHRRRCRHRRCRPHMR